MSRGFSGREKKISIPWFPMRVCVRSWRRQCSLFIPTLTAFPTTVFNALASLFTVAGNALSKHLTVILSALIKVLEEEKDEVLLVALDESLRALLRSSRKAEHVDATTSWMVRAFGPDPAGAFFSFPDLRCTGQKAMHRRVERALAIYFPPPARNQTSIRLCTASTGCDSRSH